MTNEQREAVEKLKNGEKMDFITLVRTFKKEGTEKFAVVRKEYLDTVLSLIKEQQEREELIKEYVHQEIVHYTETIKDYIDDDKEGNKHYIEELKEKREHWRDVEKLLQNKPKEELYMNWWKYGLYE